MTAWSRSGKMMILGRYNQDTQQGERSAAPRLDTRAVLQGAREVILVHGTEEYRLKVTSSGKLILTK